jgi:group I intron endonuclease
MLRISGIYKIQSISHPDRCYIGSAVNTGKRWNHHITDLRKGNHHSSKLQNHFNKYGESDLQFSILLGCEKEFLLDNEQFFLDSYKPYFNIYQTVRQYSTRNQSESSNQKRSRSMTGKKHTEESKKKMSIAFKGRPKSEEHKRKLSLYFTGKPGTPCTEEHKLKMSIDRKGAGNPMYGKHSWNHGIPMSEENKKRLVEVNTGRPGWNKGKKGVSKETRQKMANAKLGKKRPPRTKEHSQRMWESRRRNQLNKTA